IAAQIKEYKSFEHVIREGDYYCLAFPTKDSPYSAYYYATKDGGELVLTVIERAGCPKGETKPLKLRAAKAGATYCDLRTGKTYTGACLKRGIKLPLTGEKDSACLLYLKEVTEE
ncbi:MAG: GH36 C-terminal domain-containing protein, partial [Clostridia bacterium]|nr:GH36 C-terminal domain-containing protein [Clostridia bacterium]